MAQVAPMRSRTPRPLRVELVFAVLALGFGSALAVVTPPLDAPDEPRHLQRAWLLSQGRVAVPPAARGAGGAMPASLLALHPPYARGTSGCRHRIGELVGALSLPLAPERVRDPIRTPILYGPIGYVPQALAIALARGLGAGAGAVLLAARLANLVAFTLAGWLALRIAPIRRLALASAALLPMALFEASTVSADAATNGLALLLLALLLRMAVPGEPPARRRDRAGALLAIALLGLGKPGYTLLALGLAAVPAERLGGVLRRRRLVLAGLGVALVVPATWWWLVQRAGPFAFPGADPAAQLLGAMRAPGQLGSALIATLGDRGIDFARSAIGVLGRLDVALPAAAYAGYALLLVATALTDRAGAPKLSGRTRAGLAWIAGLGVIAIELLLYLVATPPGAARVAGIQGRYFLPFVPVALVALPVVRGAPPATTGWVGAAHALGLGVTAVAVWTRYYTG
jgi:hypothetical protein